jgi:fibronectin-binding autotransporter adhesin
MLLRFLFVFLGLSISIFGFSQSLTITSTGQTGTSGTNWSISGTTLTVTGTAEVNVSVITDKLATGAFSLVGNTTSFSVYIQTALSSSATNSLTIGASNNTGALSLRSTVSLGGSLTMIGGPVSILEALTLTGSSNLNITSINTVINATTTIGGSANIAATGNLILGTNITAGTGYPFTANGGITKTGSGTSYLFSDLITSNSAVTIAGPVLIGNFNTSNTTSEIKSNGGNISMTGALSAYSGNGRDYMALLYANIYDADGGSVSGSTTDIYLRFNPGAHNFVGLPGMASTIAMQYLVAGGGGGGGNSSSGNYSGGGAGGGGVADGNYTYNGTPIAIFVGAGGAQNTNGSDSYLATIKSGGGGAGGNYNYSAGLVGNGGAGYAAGGGGGGAGSNVGSGGASGGSGTQRTGGWGSSCCSLTNFGGSGGGATGNGSGYSAGGAGVSSTITGTAVSYGSGGAANGTPVAKTGGGGGAIYYGTVQGASGTVILRFALSNATTLNALAPASAVHLNAAAGGVTLGATVANFSSLLLTADAVSSIAGVISGSGSLTKSGTGMLTLSGNHTYTGGTTVNAGILKLNDTYANAGYGVIMGTLTINQNGTVQLAGSPGALGWHGTYRVSTININGGTLDAISGQQHIWNLDGGLNFNGGGTVRSNGGTSNAAATSYIEWGVGNVTVTNPTAPAIIAGRINLRSDMTSLNGAASGGVIAIQVNDGSATNDLLVSAAITQTNAATITKTGAGKMTFSGVNNHTGTMTISAGVFQVGNESTTGSISGGSVVNNASILFNRSDDYSISNIISGTGTIEKLGAGILTLSGANTYTGLSTVTQGVLKLGSTTALGTSAGSTLITTGAAIDLNGQAFSTLEPLTVNGTGLSSGGALFNSSSTAASFPGPITLASASLVKCSTGNITLSGAINGAFDLSVEALTAAYTQSGIVGATTPPTSYSINTGSGATTISANTTVAGPLTVDAGQISMNSTIASSLSNAALTFRSQKFITHTGSTGLTLTTQGGNILVSANVDDASDNDALVNGYILFSYGLTINSNGGNITLGGGDALASGYALGTNVYPYEGLRVDGTINVSSGAGNIIMRGKSYAVSTTSASWGLGFWSLTTGTITSGTGTIYLDGFSQSSGSTYSSGLFSNGTLTITSANTSADAIKLIGKGTGTASDAWGIECESALNVYATALGGGITITTSQQVADNYDAVFRAETNILAKSGPIQLLGKQGSGVANGRFYNNGNFYLGSRASSPVTTSSSNITIQYDKFDFASTVRYVATTGTVTIQPASTSFGAEFLSSWFTWNQNSQTMSSLTIGKIGNTGNITHQTNAISAAGPITIYGGDIAVNQNLTSTLSAADVLLQATGTIAVQTNRTIQSNSGQITLRSNVNGTANSAVSSITLNSGSSLLSQGGNITLGGNFTGSQGAALYATSLNAPAILLDGGTISASGGNIKLYGKCNASYDDGIRLRGTINTTGSGNIELYGEAYGGSDGTYFFGGITFGTAAGSTLEAENGNVILSGILTNTQSTSTGAINFYRSLGSAGQTNHINILSKTGDITIFADKGTTGAYGLGHSSWGNVYFGSPSNNSYTATGDIKLTYSRLVGAGLNGFKVKTTGNVTYEPVSTSFEAAQSFPFNANYTLAESAASLTIGKPSNAADITIASAQTVPGHITVYGGTLTLSGNLTATNNGNISLYSDNALGGLSSARTITAAGTFTYAPQGTSFAAAVTYPITNLTLISGGLTIGKTGNAANITIGSATSINGPITLYGGTLALNNALTTTNTATGNLSLNGTTLSGSSTLTVANGRTLTMNLSSNTNYAGLISGTSLNVIKDGAGTLTLPTPTALSFAAMTISGGAYTLNANQQLTLTGALTNNGTFTMKDGATFVQATSGTSVTGTGTYNVEKALASNSSTWSTTSGRFWYMGVPMVSVARSGYGIPGTTTNRVWSYSEATKSYTELSDGNALLSAGTGYVHRRSTDGTLTFTATGANGLYGSDYSVSGLTKTAGYTSGVHLVSNPYMAYLDWNALTKTNIDSTFYIRSNNTTSNNISALISYNSSTNQFANTSSVSITNASQIRYIAPMQSIWVRVGAAASTGSLGMNRSMLSHQTGNPGLKSSTVFPTLARVNLVDGNQFDQLLVYMNSDMSNEADQYDSEKLPVSGTVQVYTMASNKKLVMNGLKNNKKKVSVPLYLELPESKSYTLNLSEYELENGLILLEDKQEGTMQDLTLLENYTFYANSGLLQNRFVLHFILPDAEFTTQGPSNSWVGPETSYTEGGNVQITNDDRGNIQITVDQPEEQKVEGNVSVTDMNGKEVYRGQLDGITTAVELNVPAGIYYLTVQSGALFEKKKVFIQE